MDFGAVSNALVSAGGYAVLAGLMLWQMKSMTESHREEVLKLSEVIRENTAAIAALTAHFGRETA